VGWRSCHPSVCVLPSYLRALSLHLPQYSCLVSVLQASLLTDPTPIAFFVLLHSACSGSLPVLLSAGVRYQQASMHLTFHDDHIALFSRFLIVTLVPAARAVCSCSLPVCSFASPCRSLSLCSRCSALSRRHISSTLSAGFFW
jgi:hypothetical protein